MVKRWTVKVSPTTYYLYFGMGGVAIAAGNSTVRFLSPCCQQSILVHHTPTTPGLRPSRNDVSWQCQRCRRNVPVGYPTGWEEISSLKILEATEHMLHLDCNINIHEATLLAHEVWRWMQNVSIFVHKSEGELTEELNQILEGTNIALSGNWSFSCD